MKPAILNLALALAAITSPAAAQDAPAATQPAQTPADRIFLETDGAIIVEVESAPPAGQWTAETEMKGFTGTCYYTWRGPDLFNQPGQGVLAYRIRVFTPGRYNLRLHNRHDFEDSTEENDVWTRLDDGKWIKCYSSWRGRWVWHSAHEHSHDEKVPASYELTEGDHTFYLSGRSKNFSIDRFVLYRGGDPDAGKPLLEGPESAMLLSRIESLAVPEMPEIEKLPQLAEAWRRGNLWIAYFGTCFAEEFDDAHELDEQGAREVKIITETIGDYIAERHEAIRQIAKHDILMATEMTEQLTRQTIPFPELARCSHTGMKNPALEAARKAAELLFKAQTLAIGLPPARQAETQPALQAQRDEKLPLIREKIEQIRSEYPDTVQRWRAETLAAELGLE